MNSAQYFIPLNYYEVISLYTCIWQLLFSRLEVQFENLDERENSFTTGPCGSKEKSKLTPPKHGYSTPLHRNSICMELKDRVSLTLLNMVTAPRFIETLSVWK